MDGIVYVVSIPVPTPFREGDNEENVEETAESTVKKGTKRSTCHAEARSGNGSVLSLPGVTFTCSGGETDASS